MRARPFSRTPVKSVLLACLYVAIASACIAVFTAAAVAAEAQSSSSFRCLRTFGVVDSFATVAKTDVSQNCNFHYFTVTDASAELSCITTMSDDALSSISAGAAPVKGGRNKDQKKHDMLDEGATSCNVTVRWSMRRADNVVQLLRRQVGTDADYFARNASETSTLSAAAAPPGEKERQQRMPAKSFLTEDDDVWRYALSLRAKGDSTVQYKGFLNGDGYSLCCDGITESECAWMAAEQGDNDMAADEEVNPSFALQQRRMLRGCPLPFPSAMPSEEKSDYDAFGTAPGARVLLTDLDEKDAEEGSEEGVFHGKVLKPLHRLVEGPWDVTVQMWRRRQRLPRASSTGAAASAVPADDSPEAEVLGRVVVPFRLNLAELQKEGRVQHVESMALTVEEVAEDDREDL